MLRVEGVPLDSGRPGLTFSVKPGQCVGLLGCDAASLERFAETLSGMRRPIAGRVLVGDVDIARAGARVSMNLPRAANARVTLLEHVAAITQSRGPLRAPIAEATTRLGLDARLRLRTPGARTAAALTAALAPETSVVILCRPFDGLAEFGEPARARAIDWIRSLAKTATSVVFIGTEERDVRAVSHVVIAAEPGR